MRNMQTPNRVTPSPQASLVILRPITAHPKTRRQTRLQQNSTESDTIRQNATECNENSCAHAREATAFRSFLSAWVAPRRIGRIAGSLRPRTAMPTDRTKPGLDIP